MVRREYLRRFGPEAWARSRRLIEEVWEGIRAKLLALQLPWERVRIYQDGLPVSGREMEIAEEVAAQGSKNYQLILELVQRGASLEGTESPDLLSSEYAQIRRIAEARSGAEREEAKRRYTADSARILKARDEFISRRIDETLKEGEVGLLFVGMMHQVDRFLPPGIEVQYVIYRLPLREGWEL